MIFLDILDACEILSVFSRLELSSAKLREYPARHKLKEDLNETDESYKALKELPVMVSVIKDGAVVKQKDVQFNSSATFSLPAGLYDVRLEGDGMQTLVKRGIHVNEGERTNIIGGPMRVGTGVRIIEYATGGLSREEIAARLAKLEAAVAELQKARQTR